MFNRFTIITNRENRNTTDYAEFIIKCIVAGVTCVQLREKNTNEDFLIEFGLKLKNLLDPLGVPLIINDNIRVAAKIGAAGVHLGQADGDPRAAREILGESAIIGVSIENEEEIEPANTSNINYIAASAVFSSKNKHNIKKIWGLEGLRTLAKISKHPIIAIGGINIDNVQSVLNAGAAGIAVIGAIHDSQDPFATIKTLRQAIDDYFDK